MTLTALEAQVLAGFRSGADLPGQAVEEDETWAAFGLHVTLRALRMLRESQSRAEPELKSDGSPVTVLDHEVESMVGRALESFRPDAVLVGEEGGGTLPAAGAALAIDPIDGTWAQISQTGSSSVTLALIRDGETAVGIVANPMTAEVGYAVRGRGSRLLRLSALGEPDSGIDLPNLQPAGRGATLVNLHPSRSSEVVATKLRGAWLESRIQLLRSPGGSPSWSILEASRGEFVYVNLWSKRPSAPWDLAAATLLIREAGGEIVDPQQLPIDPLTHSGPFVAAVDAPARAKVAGLVLEALAAPEST